MSRVVELIGVIRHAFSPSFLWGQVARKAVMTSPIFHRPWLLLRVGQPFSGVGYNQPYHEPTKNPRFLIENAGLERGR